jgi:hypothetical protein
MAGSLFWFQYTTDAGLKYVVLVDKSNSLAKTTGGLQLMDPYATAGLARLVIGRTKLRVVYGTNAANSAQKRRFIVGNPAAYAELAKGGATLKTEDYPVGGGAAGAQQTWNITATRAEKIKLAPPITVADSGLVV